MAKPTIKQKILQTLISNGPKKTGQIAKELGYIDKKTGYGQYNVIKPDCNKLVNDKHIHEIEPVIKTRGNPGTTYDIIYKMDNLKKLLNEYHSLLQDLQANDKIRSMILEKFNYFKNNEFLYNEFKLKLLVSPTFFKWCLSSNLTTLENAAQSSQTVSILGYNPPEHIEHKPLKGEHITIPDTEYETDIDFLFFSCCVTDALEALQPNETTLKRLEKEFAGHERQLELIQYLRSCNS